MNKLTNKNTPEIRFTDFEDEWKEQKLSNFCNINPSSNDKLPESFVYIDLESVKQGSLLQKQYIYLKDAPSRAQRYLKPNDILFQMVRPYQKNNLYFNLTDENYIASTGYAQLRTKNNSEFLFQLIHTSSFVKKVLVKCTGSSYPAINSKDLSTIRISYPSQNEQTKIASFLTSIDQLISQINQKIETLEEYKVGVMQKLFSQELRFTDAKGNNFEDWEYKNLKKIAKVFIGLVTTMTTNYVNEGVLLIRNSDIKPNKVRLEKLINLEEGFANNYNSRKLRTKDIVTVHTGDVGVSALITEDLDGCLGFATLNTRINDSNVLPEYVCWYFNSHEFIKWSLSMSTGDGRQNLNLKDFVKAVIPLPSLAEQQKIAGFLQAIDQKIAYMHEQLVLTQEFRQGLLQKMFI